MKDRQVIDIHNIEFKPFDRYGSPVPKMSWHIISYNQTSGQGSYVLKMEPGAQTVPHMHMGFEEFLMTARAAISLRGLTAFLFPSIMVSSTCKSVFLISAGII